MMKQINYIILERICYIFILIDAVWINKFGLFGTIPFLIQGTIALELCLYLKNKEIKEYGLDYK